MDSTYQQADASDMAIRTQYVPIVKHWDSNGIMQVEAIARSSGILRYRTDKGDRHEFVPPELIDSRDEHGRPAMGWLAGAPLTNEHPPQVIRQDADTRKAYQVGSVSPEMHIYKDADGERVVKVRFDVSDPITQSQIRSGAKTGVSLGYLCNVVPEAGEYRGDSYTHRQALPFKIDHLAVVASPRNPGALITKFDSSDVGIAVGDTVAAPFEVLRVDACCAACSGGDDEDEKPKKKLKQKSDSNMIPIIFFNSIQHVDEDTFNDLYSSGVVDRVRLDGRDWFVGADVAMDMHNDGLIDLEDDYHYDGFVAKAGIAKGGGKCGRGWVGVKGSCKRMTKGGNREEAQRSALKDFASSRKPMKEMAMRYGREAGVGIKRGQNVGGIAQKARDINDRSGYDDKGRMAKKITTRVMKSANSRGLSDGFQSTQEKDAIRKAVERNSRKNGGSQTAETMKVAKAMRDLKTEMANPQPARTRK